MREYLVVALKGAAMGIAEVIPGISGGTIALIAGIYDRLVTAIAGLRPAPLGHLPRLHRGAHRRALAEEVREMDLAFLVALGLGMTVMIVTLARLIAPVVEAYPGVIYAFFGGLIAASSVILYRYVSIEHAWQVALAVVAIAVTFVLSGLAAGGLGHGLPVVFVVGAVAVTAMVLPGVSGSVILVALGQWEFMLGALNGFVDAIGSAAVGDGTTAGVVETGRPVVAFVAGAAIGLVTVAHVVAYALERNRQATLLVLISFMVGALRVPGEAVLDAYRPSPWWLGATAAAAVVGVATIYVFDRYTDDLEY